MSDDVMVENRLFAEIAVGDTASLSRTLTKTELEGFAAVSGDFNPTHLNEAYARARGLKAPVAHGMWTASLISNLLGNKLPGAGTVYRGQDLRFHAPLFLGDTVTATVTVAAKEAASRTVRLDCRCANQHGEEVLTGTAEVTAPATREAIPLIERPTFSVQTHDVYEALMQRAGGIPAIPCLVAYPCDESSLRGAVEAAEAGLIEPVLVGPARKLEQVAAEHGIDLAGRAIVDVADPHAAAAKAVELVRAGQAELLMKGSLHTDELLSAVVAKETGLRTGRRISHVFIMVVPTYPEPLLITDAAVNIAPDLKTKVDIVQNAIDLALGLGMKQPRVAVLSAVETINLEIATTCEAAILSKMADRGQIKGGLIDGPFALDNAISPAAAQIKGIKSPVAGRANILLVPDLEAGNMLAKNLSFLANADAAGIVLGAAVPIILTSRADSVRTRMASCAVAALYAHARREAAEAKR
jgi:phosphotransacetylase/acyl dehydratase